MSQKMAAYVKAAGKKLRPHAKTHKCPEIARRQVAAGAVGVCVAKVGEAEVMAAAGIRNILITTEVVGPEKIGRLLACSSAQPETMVVVDHPDNVRELGEAMTRAAARAERAGGRGRAAAAAPACSRSSPRSPWPAPSCTSPRSTSAGCRAMPATAPT